MEQNEISLFKKKTKKHLGHYPNNDTGFNLVKSKLKDLQIEEGKKTSKIEFNFSPHLNSFNHSRF